MGSENVTLYAVWSSIGLTSLPFSMQLSWEHPEAATTEFRVVKSANAANIDTFAEAAAVAGGDVVLDWTTNITQAEIKGLRSNTACSLAVMARKGAVELLYPVQNGTTTNIMNPSVLSLANGDLMFAYKDIASGRGKTVVYGLDGSLKSTPKDFFVNNYQLTDTWDTKYSMARVGDVVYIGFSYTDAYYSRVSATGEWLGTKIISTDYNSTLYGPELAINGDRLFYYSAGNWTGSNQGSQRAMTKVSDNSTISFPGTVELGNVAEVRGIAACGIGINQKFIAVDSAEESNLDLYFSIYDSSDNVSTARTKIGNIKSGTIAALRMNNGNAMIAYQDGNDGNKGKVIGYDDAGAQVIAPTVFGETSGSWRLPMVNTDAGRVFIAYYDQADGSKAKYIVLNNDGSKFDDAAELAASAVPLYAANVETVDKIAIVYKDNGSSVYWFGLLNGL
jgi:hypothetical protein